MTDEIRNDNPGAGAGDDAGKAGSDAAGSDAAGSKSGGNADSGASSGTGASAGEGFAGGKTSPAGEPPAQPPAFPDTWREAMAGGDEALLKQLKRYASPTAFAEAHKSLNDRLLKGEFKKPLPKDATPEDIAAWRKDNGIPEDPAKYYDAFGKDVSVPEADKPMVDAFLSRMHAANASPEVAKAALSTYYELVQQAHAAQEEADVTRRDQAEAALRAEWGAEYRRNVGIVGNFMTSLPSPVSDALETARGADGGLLRHNPEVMRWLAGLALAENPAVHLVPGSVSDPQKAVENEIADIEKKMRTPEGYKEYWSDPRQQERYGQLLAARQGKR